MFSAGATEWNNPVSAAAIKVVSRSLRRAR
jgi:hypothetical protein